MIRLSRPSREKSNEDVACHRRAPSVRYPFYATRCLHVSPVFASRQSIFILYLVQKLDLEVILKSLAVFDGMTSVNTEWLVYIRDHGSEFIPTLRLRPYVLRNEASLARCSYTQPSPVLEIS